MMYEKYMRECLKLAKKGEGKTSPNPLVGAILVNKQGKIVSKGYHHQYGSDHAEADCIKNYEKTNSVTKYSELTMFVNLEPCSHFGKTPPCVDLIIEKGIKKIVVAVKDPNVEHSGGIEKLKENGVDVIYGVLENEAKSLNEIFFKNINEKKTFVAIKTATTLDGKIATKTGSSKWITSQKSRNYVQKLRNKYDAILTSSKTVIADNPSLTAKGKGYKNPVRVILDKDLKTPVESKVYIDDGTKVLLFYSNKSEKKYPNNVKLIKAGTDKENNVNIKDVLNTLFDEGIKSVLVEAGGILNGAFLNENLVDKIYQFIAPKLLGDKTAKNYVEGFTISDINKCLNFEIASINKFSPDVMLELNIKP